jgi:hypothetical protein
LTVRLITACFMVGSRRIYPFLPENLIGLYPSFGSYL